MYPSLTLMLLVADLTNAKNLKNILKLWQMGTHLRVLSESYVMNTHMIGLDGFQKSLRPCALDESSLSIKRVKKWFR